MSGYSADEVVNLCRARTEAVERAEKAEAYARRVVEDYDRLAAQLKLCEEHAATMARDFDASLAVVKADRDAARAKMAQFRAEFETASARADQFYKERDTLQSILDSADPFYTIKAPASADGECPAHLIHIHLSRDEKEAIDSFMGTDWAMHAITNASLKICGKPQRCAESWEVWEAKGYKVVECFLMEGRSPKDGA